MKENDITLPPDRAFLSPGGCRGKLRLEMNQVDPPHRTIRRYDL